jgi:hypothetical protein
MENRGTSGRGHAEIPGSFQRGARGRDIQCGPDQYRFGNFFGAGCTDKSKDRRSLGLGAQKLWSGLRASGATSPYGKPIRGARAAAALPVEPVGADGAAYRSSSPRRYNGSVAPSPRRYRRGY